MNERQIKLCSKNATTADLGQNLHTGVFWGADNEFAKMSPVLLPLISSYGQKPHFYGKIKTMTNI